MILTDDQLKDIIVKSCEVLGEEPDYVLIQEITVRYNKAMDSDIIDAEIEYTLFDRLAIGDTVVTADAFENYPAGTLFTVTAISEAGATLQWAATKYEVTHVVSAEMIDELFEIYTGD